MSLKSTLILLLITILMGCTTTQKSSDNYECSIFCNEQLVSIAKVKASSMEEALAITVTVGHELINVGIIPPNTKVRARCQEK